jgi:hypothetical protein
MDEIESWAIESLIQSKIGCSGRLYVLGDEPNLLLNTLLETHPTIDVLKKHQFRAYFIEGGPPELFTLTGFSTPIIWYNLNLKILLKL